MLGFSPLSAAPLASAPSAGDGHLAAGFTSTQLGTPSAAMGYFLDASGFSSTQFGAPSYTGPHVCQASGFTSTVIPIPSTLLVASGIAPTTQFGAPRHIPSTVGFSSTQFGTPGTSISVLASGFTSIAFGTSTATQRWRAQTLAPTARLGTPSTPTDRTLEASGANTTLFGQPAVFRYLPAITLQTRAAQGFALLRFGLPYAGPKTARAGIASGFAPVTLGAPVALHHRSETASGFASTVLGIPATPLVTSGIAPGATFGAAAARETFAVTGARATSFGAASARRIQAATGLHRATRFGAASCSRGNSYTPWGIDCAGKFGQPTALNRFNYPASGFAPAAFGAPVCTQRHRATMTAPVARFGQAVMKRNPACIDRWAVSALGPVTRFGAPRTQLRQTATSLGPVTRFGTPS
jgi:hypothetical protein